MRTIINTPGKVMNPLSAWLVTSREHTDQSTPHTAAMPAIHITAAMARNGQRTGDRVPEFDVEAIMKNGQRLVIEVTARERGYQRPEQDKLPPRL